MDKSHGALYSSGNTQDQVNAGGVPLWMVAEKISFWEKAEVRLYQLISVLPVFVTFGLFSYLLFFYAYLFLYPCLAGSFQQTVDIPDLWRNSIDKESAFEAARVYAVIFSIMAVFLAISIVQTIRINPGNIPEDKEWDMLTDSMADSSSSNEEIESAVSMSEAATPTYPHERGDARKKNVEPLTNSAIMDDAEEPKEASHLDYKYLKSYEGPLTKPATTQRRQNQQLPLEPSRSSEAPGSALEEEAEGLISRHHSTKKKKKEKGKALFSFERKKLGGIRMCQRCLRTKPDRCHHCSQCNKCILKMDHHCPWVANCIGFYNYKYFLNMLFYTSATNWFIIATSWPLFAQVLEHDSIDYWLSYYVITSYLLAGTLALVLGAFFSFHIWLISKQYTTIEFCEKRSDGDSNFRTSPYNRGLIQNLQNSLGNNPLTWLIPFSPKNKGEGLVFEVRDELIHQVTYKTM